MSHYLSTDQHEAIKKLRENQGMLVREIAKRFNVSHATVSNVCKGKTVPRGAAKILRRPPKTKMPDAREVEFQDYSILPDTVLFQHVKESNFIG